MQLAESLEAADSRTFVYVDDAGRVRPAWRYRLVQRASWSVLVLLSLGSAFVLALLGGWIGTLVALLLIALVAHLALLSSWLHRGVVLLAHERLDAADRLLERTVRFSLFHLGVRALALQNRSAVAQRRSDHQTAYALGERALRLRDRLPAPFGRGLHHWLLRYGQVILLCNLGQLDAARARLAGIRHPPPGEYIRLRRWTAELYLALASDELEIDRAELELRTTRATELRTSPELLGLCAWAWASLGQRERAERHVRSARALAEASPFAESLPALAHWMNAFGHDDPRSASDPPSDAG